MCKRVGTGDDDYYLEWYHLPDPAAYYPSATNKPDAADLSASWVKLSVETPHSSYVNGYIKEQGVDPLYPHVPVPIATSGASSSSHYCDFASIAFPPAIRAVRRRGFIADSRQAGPRCLSADNEPSAPNFNWGSALYMIQ